MPRIIDLSSTVAMVTGASRGLGQAMALALAEAGADLALTGRSVEDLERTASEVVKYGVRAQVVPADMRRQTDVEALVEGTMRAFGRIDVLVNNAGIAGNEKPFLEVAPDEWDDVLTVNLRGPAVCAQTVARTMVPRRRGRIINVASITGLRPIPRLGPYSVSKAALIHLTRVMAIELARYNVQVNTVCPGYFNTPMNEALFASAAGQDIIQRSIPMRRLGEPAELAPTVVFLASGASSFMTGSLILVDGGQMLT